MKKSALLLTMAASFGAWAAPGGPLAHGCYLQAKLSASESGVNGTVSCISKTGEVTSDQAAAVGIVDIDPSLVGQLTDSKIFITLLGVEAATALNGEYTLSTTPEGFVGTEANSAAKAQVALEKPVDLDGSTLIVQSNEEQVEKVVYRRGVAGPGMYRRGGAVARGGVYRRGVGVGVGAAAVGAAAVGGAAARSSYCYHHPGEC